ncbi:hypothetical protein EDD86DRAFT_212795 [Gorgonomyces haynaldii]|nr:hypothetical protein EDD86DRAFT_212795 [Gorgonomyces haynaldii]
MRMGFLRGNKSHSSQDSNYQRNPDTGVYERRREPSENRKDSETLRRESETLRRDSAREERRERGEKRVNSAEPSPKMTRSRSRQRREEPQETRSTSRRRAPPPVEEPPPMPRNSQVPSFDAMLNDLDDMFASTSVQTSRSSDKPERTRDRPTFRRRPSTNEKSPEPERKVERKTEKVAEAIPESPKSPIDGHLSELEKIEMEKNRKQLERLNQERKAASRREAEMVAAEREKRNQQDRERRHRESGEFSLLNRQPPDESLLVDDYVKALITVLRSDRTVSPLPEDFSTPEGFSGWRQSIRIPLQDMLAKMLKYRHLVKKEPTSQPPRLFFKIVSARGIVSKEGRLRDIYCNIDCGDLEKLRKEKKRNVFQTDTIKQTLDPVWNQHLNLEMQSSRDDIKVEVWDRLKDHFLGQVIIPMDNLMRQCGRKDFVSSWYPLEPRESKYKDKYVGGEILIEAALEEDKNKGGNSFEQLQSKMDSFGVDPRALFRTLLRGCLLLDLGIPRDGRQEVLSEESVSLLKVWGRYWTVAEPAQLILYLEIIFSKFRGESVPVDEVLKTFHVLHHCMKTKGWFSSKETKRLLTILEDMRDHLRTQVTKYRECYPKNKPPNALDSSILLLRMIHRFPIFKQAHPELPDSFRDELRNALTEACIARFQRFKELNTPFDESNVEAVVDGITKLAEMISDEIEQDFKYFQPAFAQELDIVRLTAGVHLKFFVLTLEDSGDLLSSDVAVKEASKTVFSFYKRVKLMNDRYAKLVPGLTTSTSGTGFDVEGWFSPFIFKWLQELAKKTIVWVQNAIKVDNFESISPEEEDLLHSSSITDVFSAIYSELEFITDLEWSNSVQNAYFFQMFAKMVNAALENYCEQIQESKEAGGGLLQTATNLLGGRNNGPQDIQNQSCVKLRNIQFAMSKLKEMYKMMNVQAISKTVKDHRKSMAILGKKSPAAMAADKAEGITGAFKVYVSYGENIKPINKNGLSNPYVIVRVPEGTIVPPDEEMETKKKKDDDKPLQPTVLTGSQCDLVRTRAISDSLNPSWEETHQIILPPVTRLEVAVFSKNLLTADEVAGTAIIDLSSGTRLRRKVLDYQTHDLYVELEPQGRVLLRLTMEGEQEDVDFWFRRTNERLIRTRDDLLRSLTAKMVPYAREVILKVVKENEAAPIPSKSFLASLTQAVQYSEFTAANVSIHTPVSDKEVDEALDSLIVYLEKNLETICANLSQSMSQEVIKRTWDEIVAILESVVLPPLYGTIEASKRLLNKRQLSMVDGVLLALKDFFHADGQDLGLDMDILQSRMYLGLKDSIKLYFVPMPKVMREYELSFREGVDKEYLLRLIRFNAEKSKDDKMNDWMNITLQKRKSKN